MYSGLLDKWSMLKLNLIGFSSYRLLAHLWGVILRGWKMKPSRILEFEPSGFGIR